MHGQSRRLTVDIHAASLYNGSILERSFNVAHKMIFIALNVECQEDQDITEAMVAAVRQGDYIELSDRPALEALLAEQDRLAQQDKD